MFKNKLNLLSLDIMTEKIPIYYLIYLTYDSGWISSTGDLKTSLKVNKSKFALTASSGTTALHLALLACYRKK